MRLHRAYGRDFERLGIGVRAFQGCTALTEIDLSCVTEIGDCAFNQCTSSDSDEGAEIMQIYIPENVITVGSRVFYGTTVTVTVYFEEGALPEGWAADWADDMNEGSLIIYAQPEEGEGGGNTEGTGSGNTEGTGSGNTEGTGSGNTEGTGTQEGIQE